MTREMTDFTDEEMAEFRRSDTWKLDQAEETLHNLGWEWDEEAGAWTR